MAKATAREWTELDLVRKAQRDPVWWMEECCGWRLWQKQKEIVRALATHDRVAVPAAFGVGKTFIAGRVAPWWLNTRPDSLVVTTAPTGRQVKDLLWAEIKNAYHTSKLPLGGDVLSTEIRISPKWFATGFATNEEHIDKFTGYHSPYMLLIFDQACGIHKQIWTAGEGLLTSSNSKWLALSNTTDEASEFANICLPDRRSDFGTTCEDPECKGCNGWKIIKITAHDSPNVIAGYNKIPGILSYDYVQKKKEVWRPGDPLWSVYIEANFVESGAMTVLHPAMVREILEKNEVEADFDNMVLAADIGDEGTDPTVCALACGARLGFIDRILGNDTMQSVKFIIECWDKAIRLTGHKPVAINVDKIGVGAGVVSRLLELEYPVMGINVGMKAVNDLEFINRRIEMAWSIRRQAEARAISWKPLYFTDPQLLEMLREDMGIRYEPLPTQRIKLEDKVKFRRRMRRSSDFWDTMMLGFADNTGMPYVSSPDVGMSLPRLSEVERLNEIDPAEAAAQLKLLQKMFGHGRLSEADFRNETYL